jgi:hypothetical protein
VQPLRFVVVGGGAAGIFAAAAAAEVNPRARVTVLEKGTSFLSKVRISGGGRCNVTHACFDPRQFSEYYPRGGQALIGPFHRFQAHDTVAWFEARGVSLKTERDGRMFPVTDSSETVMDALLGACRKSGVRLDAHAEVLRVEPQRDQTFRLTLAGGRIEACEGLLLATGGVRGRHAQELFRQLGHAVEPPVPSLFTFNIELPWLRGLAGVSVADVVVAVPGTALKERGPILATHWGLSGPAILRLSAWGARELHARDYRFALQVDWLPGMTESAVAREIADRRRTQSAKALGSVAVQPLPSRLWTQLVQAAGLRATTRWAEVSGPRLHALVQGLKHTTLPVAGKSLNKEEFVTCGGVSLKEVDLKTMESRRVPHLYFAGEALDVDGLTGGFNFQAAWTTGWIAGRSAVGN